DELPYDDVEWETKKKVLSQEERMNKGQAHIANLKAMFTKK
ncbi:MAG: 3'-5' exonuclease, partial [Vibrio sp.]